MSTNLFDITSLSPLYEAVQMSGIYSDSKYFVDAIPKQSSQQIMNAYAKSKDEPTFNLGDFIEEYFDLPRASHKEYSSEQKPIQEHLNELWDILQRRPDQQGGTLINLPYPYIVPGGRFREIYYWDSYFTMLGLELSGRYDLIENMIKNFAFLIDKVGHIPNGNRTYYLSRSQPPFFSLMVSLLVSIRDASVWVEYLPSLEKEYQFWMDGAEQLTENDPAYRRVVKMPDGSILNRYWDDNPTPRPEAYIEDLHIAKASGKDLKTVYRHIRAAAESGWDFSSRWFADQQNMETIQTSDLIPVDLNCLLLHLETALWNAYTERKEHNRAAYILIRSTERKKAIQSYCWNGVTEYYHDYHFTFHKTTPNITMAGCFPLFMGIADQEQSRLVAKLAEEQLLGEGGMRTTTLQTGQQWDSPNGWAPLQWIAYKGFTDYGHHTLAEKLATRWTSLNERTYASTGKMMEKYNVVDINTKAGGGEYPNQDGFGWTNGVYLKLKHALTTTK